MGVKRQFGLSALLRPTINTHSHSNTEPAGGGFC